MFKFYTAPHTCALAVHIVLEEVGAPYERVRVDFSANAQRSAEYLAVNPKARVPTLATPQGILTETPALLAYLAQSFPEARLAPLDDPFAFARLQSFNFYLGATVHVAHAHRPRGARWADDEAAQAAMRLKVPQNMTDCFTLIERDLAGPWVFGEQYTIADPYLFTMASWLESDGVDIALFPKVQAHHARMRARPAVVRALALAEAP